jgi:hypothetical protein
MSTQLAAMILAARTEKLKSQLWSVFMEFQDLWVEDMASKIEQLMDEIDSLNCYLPEEVSHVA